jgi:hypothetical protein
VAETRQSRLTSPVYPPFSGIRLLYSDFDPNYIGFDILAILLFALWALLKTML